MEMRGKSLQSEFQYNKEMKIIKIALGILILGSLCNLTSCCNKDNCDDQKIEQMENTKPVINATPEELAGISLALDKYIEAAIKGDSKIAKPVFAQTATISHSENDSLVSGPIQELFDYYDQTGPHHAEYEITSAQVADNVAVVSIDSKFGNVGFDDMFTLVKDGKDWKIVSKVFHVK